MEVAEGEEQTTRLLTARVLTLNFGAIHVSIDCFSVHLHLTSSAVDNCSCMSDSIFLDQALTDKYRVSVMRYFTLRLTRNTSNPFGRK